ncbi:YjgN family protein [Sphingomonas sp.]|uniref:YjgN family protein n=1 Tax=Sphingomonas sp. TaxID=28214 RepID=UPI002BD6186C|nr:YjgN family protein [Sphingomonas sp.]HWK35134.1 YjgN family protein [Sphingomonas sp.]
MTDEPLPEPLPPPTESAFQFHGNWREFAPIAFTNLLLTIVTLGIYAFWARARERRYLWSRTHFIDDRLEWTGTGLELFVGYLMALVFFLLPLAGLQFLMQALILRGHPGQAILLMILLYVLLLYLIGVAVFRALRYRLSRTFWHGIRGGSDIQGLRYGVEHLWRTLLGGLALGLMVPWSMTSLWNRRWREMSFGPLRFESDADWNRIIGRYLIFYLSPIALLVVLGILMATGALAVGSIAGVDGEGASRESVMAGLVIVLGAFYILFFVVLGLVALFFYSAYYREAVGKLTLGSLSFAFTARTRDWMKLVLGNIGLVIVTLGIGFLFVPYRNWKFFVTHIEAYGELRLDELTQSTTRAPPQGEGLLDAFDVGAF